jgi:hypothetical protein
MEPHLSQISPSSDSDKFASIEVTSQRIFLPICIKTFQQNMGGPFQLLNKLQSKNVAVTFKEVNIKK